MRHRVHREFIAITYCEVDGGGQGHIHPKPGKGTRRVVGHSPSSRGGASGLVDRRLHSCVVLCSESPHAWRNSQPSWSVGNKERSALCSLQRVRAPDSHWLYVPMDWPWGGGSS